MKKRNTTQKNTPWQTILLVGMCIVFFFSSMYTYRCVITKVCQVVFVEKLIRHDMTITMPKGAIEVEVADTQASRELGLSGRKKMGNDEGLLFAFDVQGKYGFWMKDMLFPLDIVWINQNGTVVSIERDLTPETYPQVFINQPEAIYVLEINAGQAERFGLYLGSQVKLQ